MTDICAYGETVLNQGHPYALRCLMPPDHVGRHSLAPAHRVMWEQVHGTPPPARVAHLRPINGDWLDLSPTNWEVVSHQQSQREAASRRRGESTDKHCRECGELLPFEDFAPRRNVCKVCWKERLRSNENKRREHVSKYNCYVLDGKHYHITDYESSMRYTFALFYRTLRQENPDPVRYNQAVGYMRARLRRGIQSTQEVNDGNKKEEA